MPKELRLPRINTIIISGRLTRDVNLRYTPGGTAVAGFSLAVDRSYKKGDEWIQETSYIDIVVWSYKAEQCAEQLHKGSPVLVEGYLRTRTYETKDGQNRKIAEIVANKVSFLEKATSSEEFNEQPNEKKVAPEATTTDDEVPF